MTSAQIMLTQERCARPGIVRVLVSLLLLLPFGCRVQPTHGPLRAPSVLLAPYDASRGEVLWAVAPVRNESGTSAMDALAVSDAVVAAAAQVRGLSVKPLNATIEAMRNLGLTELATPADVLKLATELGVDGMLIGSVTAYDPYDPPTLGLALALYARTDPMSVPGPDLPDTRVLEYQPTDWRFFPRSRHADAPASVVSLHLDGRNHSTQMRLRDYAVGRHEERSAYGWRAYLASMDLYTQFAAHDAVSRLLDHEWIRLTREMGPDQDEPR